MSYNEEYYRDDFWPIAMMIISIGLVTIAFAFGAIYLAENSKELSSACEDIGGTKVLRNKCFVDGEIKEMYRIDGKVLIEGVKDWKIRVID